MDALTIRDFRSNMASSFKRVDAGGRVLIRRNNRLYTIVPVEIEEEELHEPNEITEKAILEAMALSEKINQMGASVVYDTK